MSATDQAQSQQVGTGEGQLAVTARCRTGSRAVPGTAPPAGAIAGTAPVAALVAALAASTSGAAATEGRGRGG
jgi:hypothetical protein